MKDISSKELSRLLDEGFEGKILFEGRVLCRVPNSLSNNGAEFFYQATGKFDLTPPESHREYYCLNLNEEREKGHYFLFKKSKDKKMSYDNEERYGPVIIVPITLAKDAILQIEPRGKIVF